MDDNKISLILPFRNTQEYLAECLESILEQHYTNWEVIAVDDFSTDESFHLVQSYATKDHRIKLFKNNDKGLIGALRLGRKNASGAYISRMDSDDIMGPDKLNVLLNPLLINGMGHLSVGKVKYFMDGELGEGFRKYEAWLNSLTESGRNFTEIYKECVIPSPNWLVHMDDFDKCGGFNSDTYPEDYDLAFRFFQNDLKVIPCEKTTHFWRDYPTRTSRTDSNYKDHAFIDLKMDYFLKMDKDAKRDLILWGAGDKGKRIAKILIEKEIHFQWICDNPKKVGKDIYGKTMLDWKEIEKHPTAQSIISVANQMAQKEIKDYFLTKNHISNLDYFFFC